MRESITDIYSSCRLIVRKNGAEIYNRTALDNTLIYSGVIDMPAGHGHMTLEFSVSAWLVNDWYPTASISDLLVVVMKKATAGISIQLNFITQYGHQKWRLFYCRKARGNYA